MTIRSIALFTVLCFGILTVWVRELWAPSAYQVAIFLLAIVAVTQGIRGRAHLTPAGWFPLIALGLAPVIGVAQIWTGASAYSWATLTQTLEWTAMVCVLGLVCALPEREAPLFRKAILWFTFLLAAVATLQYFTAQGKIFWLFAIDSPVAFGPFPNRNHWAAFIQLTLPVAIYQLARTPRDPWISALMIGVMYASVIAGASKAGTILCTVALVVVPLLLWKHTVNRRRFAFMLIGILAVTGALTWVVGPEVVWARLMASDQYKLRREFLLSSLTMFREHPLSGYGIGTWATVYPEFAILDPGVHANEAHNEWAQWAVEGGAPLLAIMLSIAVWTLVRVWRFPWALGLLLVFLHSLVEYPFERQALAGWCCAALGLLAHPSTVEDAPHRSKKKVKSSVL